MRSFRIGSAYGIPIKLDLTFLLVLPLFAWIIGSQIGSRIALLNTTFGAEIAAGQLSSGLTPWILGAIAAIGLFVCVVLHEFGHSLTALHYDVEIEAITLWIFGGVSEFTDLPDEWTNEIAIAIAGPIVSVVLSVLFYLAFNWIPTGVDFVVFLFGYLALINTVLAVFNLLPAFPMDGGRILRAFLARNRSFARATELAASVGKFLAVILGLFGLFSFQLLLIGIAFFIYIGASSESQQTRMQGAFNDVSTRDLMTPAEHLRTISPDETVATLSKRMVSECHTSYPVVANDELVGMVTLSDTTDIKEEEREAYTVEDIMAADLRTILPDRDAVDALNEMRQHGVGRLAVVDEQNDLVGLLSRSDVMTAFEIIKSSGALQPQQSESMDEPPLSQLSDDTDTSN
jgi:Zn-dependent protease/CBS domain-containing protein